MSSEEISRLIQAALHARGYSYAPYSKFHVGAAVRLETGDIISGANQENAAYPSGLCAERTAMFAASAKYPDKDICIVESEKTAILCSLLYPDKLWLATGGCSGLTKDKLTPLKGKSILVFPDSGTFYKWYCVLLQCQHIQANIVSFIEQYPANTDIADVLLENEKILPLKQLLKGR